MTIRGAAVDDLLAYVFDRKPHALRPAMTTWMTSSRRFAQFVDTYRDKIRKKLRGAHEREAGRDIQAELETAYRLLQERRFEVEYEKYGVGQGRCPDFTVTYRTNLVFNVEVTRMRASERLPNTAAVAVEADIAPAADTVQRENARLTEVVCVKLGQMPPGVMNLLWVVANGSVADEVDVAAAMKALKARAEGKDGNLFARHGFRDTADFFKQYGRLSGIMLKASGDEAGQRSALWLNHQAQHPIPPAIRTILDTRA